MLEHALKQLETFVHVSAASLWEISFVVRLRFGSSRQAAAVRLNWLVSFQPPEEMGNK